MKFKANAKALAATLAAIMPTVERRNTIPILNNIALTVDGGEVTIEATNLDMWTSIAMEADCESDGQVTVPGQIFYSMVRNLNAADGDSLTFEVMDDQNARVQFKKSRYKIATLPFRDFPRPGPIDYPTSFILTAEDAATLFKSCAIAMSNEETRYYLNGIYLCAQPIKNLADGRDRLAAVATNGHQLAAAGVDLPDGAAGMEGVIVPRAAVGIIVGLLNGDAETIPIRVCNQRIEFEIGRVTLTSKLVDGTYPDFERVMPAKGTAPVILDTDQIRTTSKSLAGFINGTAAIAIDIEGDQARFSGRDNNTGNEAEDTVRVDYQGDPIRIGFNVKYVAEYFGAIGTDTTDMHLSGDQSPALFIPHGRDDVQFVLMPMRV